MPGSNAARTPDPALGRRAPLLRAAAARLCRAPSGRRARFRVRHQHRSASALSAGGRVRRRDRRPVLEQRHGPADGPGAGRPGAAARRAPHPAAGGRLSRPCRRHHLRAAVHALPRSVPARRHAGRDRRADRGRSGALSRTHRGAGHRDQRARLPRDAALEPGDRRSTHSWMRSRPAAPRAVGSAPALVAAMAEGARARAASARRLCVARRRRRSGAAHRALGGAGARGRARRLHSAPRGEPRGGLGLPRLHAFARRPGGDRRGRAVPDRRAARRPMRAGRTDPARRQLRPAARSRIAARRLLARWRAALGRPTTSTGGTEP